MRGRGTCQRIALIRATKAQGVWARLLAIEPQSECRRIKTAGRYRCGGQVGKEKKVRQCVTAHAPVAIAQTPVHGTIIKVSTLAYKRLNKNRAAGSNSLHTGTRIMYKPPREGLPGKY